MVDISDKEPTRRVAQASCVVATGPASRDHDHDFDHDFDVDVDHEEGHPPGLTPGVVLAARLAGIQAAKRTADVIPLCHPLALSSVRLDVERHPRGYVVTSEVVTTGRTGVEMEALTACHFAALALVDALVRRDPEVRVEDLTLLRKSGGKSGDWGRDVATR